MKGLATLEKDGMIVFSHFSRIAWSKMISDCYLGGVIRKEEKEKKEEKEGRKKVKEIKKGRKKEGKQRKKE